MISDTTRYHGIVFSEIARKERNVLIDQFDSKSSSSYIINGVGLFIKYSTKRMSPWHFTFIKDHQHEIEKIKSRHNHIVIALVCGNDGIAALSYDELKQVLDHNIEDVERITVRRPPRGKYRVSGTDGEMDRTIGISDFPGKLFHRSKRWKKLSALRRRKKDQSAKHLSMGEVISDRMPWSR